MFKGLSFPQVVHYWCYLGYKICTVINNMSFSVIHSNNYQDIRIKRMD